VTRSVYPVVGTALVVLNVLLWTFVLDTEARCASSGGVLEEGPVVLLCEPLPGMPQPIRQSAREAVCRK